MQKLFWFSQRLTRDGHGSLSFLSEQWIGQSAVVGAVGLQDDGQDALHAEETLLVGYLRDGDVVRQVASGAVLPQHLRLRITAVRHAGEGDRVAGPQVGLGAPGDQRFGERCWRERERTS